MPVLLLLLSSLLRCILSQSTFSSSPVDTVSIEDGNITLDCSVNSFMLGDVLQWYKGSHSISNGITVIPEFSQRAYIEGGSTTYNSGQYNLIISQLQTIDSDEYRCTHHKLGSENAVGTLPAIVTVLHKPVCTQNPPLVNVVGQSVDMTCSLDDRDVDNDAVITVQWTQSDIVISASPITITVQKMLVGLNNHEEFVCQLVVTGMPSTIRSCSLTPLSINPSATIFPQNVYRVSRGTSIMYQCDPTAYPHVSSIDWLINGQSNIHDYNNIFDFELSNDRMMFTITITTYGDTSSVSYHISCRVYDPMGFTGDSASTTVIVQPVIMSTAPSITQKLSTTSIPISFVEKPVNVSAISGSTIVLDCAVNHIGDGQMKWFYVQEKIYILVGLEVISTSDDIGTRYSIVGGSDAYSVGQYALQITDAKVTDSGTYFCSYASAATSRSFSSPYAYVSINISPVAKTDLMPTYASITTMVAMPNAPVSFVKTPSNTNTTIGSTAILECSVNYLGDGQMKWFKVETGRYIMIGLDVSISASDDIRSRYSIAGGNEAFSRGRYNLQITNVKNSDSGTYFCQYSSVDSTSISSGYAKLTLVAELVCQKDPNHALPSGTMVTLNCMINDESDLTHVIWQNHLGISLTIPNPNNVAYTFMLQPTDNYKTFTCSDNVDDFARTCSLTPLAIPPVVKIVEEDSEVAGGIAINFTCQAEAEPYVSKYEWLINGNAPMAFNSSFEVNIENDGILELLPIFNGEEDTVYNITCTVYIPSGQNTTSKGALLYVYDRGHTSPQTSDDALTVVTLVVIGFICVIVSIVILLLCYVFVCYGRRRKLSLARKISFNPKFMSGGRYEERGSEGNGPIDGYGFDMDGIYASPSKVRNGKKRGITEKKAENASRESIYENSAGSDHRQSISSEYMNYDHDELVDRGGGGIHPVGFPNFGYCPESPTSLRLNTSTLPTAKPAVAPKPQLIKRLSSFEPLPDVCNSPKYDQTFNNLFKKENNRILVEIPQDELIYSNEPVNSINNHIYDDFDSDSFDSDSEDETHM